MDLLFGDGWRLDANPLANLRFHPEVKLSSLALQMLNGISKPIHKLLTLTLVNDIVQVVVDVSYVALVPWVQLTSNPVSVFV